MENLARTDPEVAEAIRNETERQGRQLEMIASENFVSEAVLEALGTVLTNKYAEGYPGRRYYGGCEFVDVAETLAIARAKEIFGADHANVQPHSGAQANTSVYLAACKPGDTILGMNLSHGGHLTHGHPLNFSGKYFNVVAYGVRKDDERIDYEELVRLAVESKPRIIVVGASAYPRTIDFKAVRAAADASGALVMADIAHIAGLVAAGLHPSPVPHCEFVTTTTHKTLRGPRGGLILCKEAWAKEVDKAVFPGVQGGPLMHVIAAKAVAFKEALLPEWKAYQKQIVANAAALAAALQGEGWRLVSGGTDNHLMLVDVFAKGITGKVAEKALDKAGITANKNTIPFDTNSPMVASGIRLGTPALTSRGMKEADMAEVAKSRLARPSPRRERDRARRGEARRAEDVRAVPAVRRAARRLREGAREGLRPEPRRAPLARNARGIGARYSASTTPARSHRHGDPAARGHGRARPVRPRPPAPRAGREGGPGAGPLRRHRDRRRAAQLGVGPERARHRPNPRERRHSLVSGACVAGRGAGAELGGGHARGPRRAAGRGHPLRPRSRAAGDRRRRRASGAWCARARRSWATSRAAPGAAGSSR